MIGTKNGITDIVNMKFHEFLHRVTLDHHAYMFLFWWMNDDFLQGLSPEIRKVVASGFHHLTSMASDDPKFTALAGYAAFKENGGEVYVPTPEEKAQFVESVQPLKQWYVDRFGDKWLMLLEEIHCPGREGDRGGGREAAQLSRPRLAKWPAASFRRSRVFLAGGGAVPGSRNVLSVARHRPQIASGTGALTSE